MITFTPIYEPDYSRIMFACIVDARASIPQITNQIGVVIQQYVNSQIALVGSNSICYRIESSQGVICGFFTININTVNKTALLGQFVLRPAFLQFQQTISMNITKFIQNLEFQPDYLFD